MLEKDIENLLAKYPHEFLHNYDLTLKGQQVKLGSYYADVVFEDGRGDMIIVEIKRGILRRDALGQIIEYYGLLRQKEPSKNIRLILVANVIPKEMTVFPSEKLEMEFVEVPAVKIREIARRYSYHFLDSEKPELMREYRETIQEFDVETGSGKPRVWMFQANPQRYDILNALADKVDKDTWTVNQHQNEIHSGDIGLIWMSGKEGGIYAVVDVISDPEMLVDSEAMTKYWLSEEDRGQKRLRVRIKYRLKLANNPIMREELRNIPDLQNMAILKQAQGTNFPVMQHEWMIISNIIKERFELER